jgi:protein-disulfide isomerase
MGNPKAPVTVVEYAAPSCPHCAHFDTTMFPQMKKDYIDTGKIYYVFRVFPLSQVDVAAESMARCLPADNYFQFIDLLFRNQDKWDPDGYQIPDVHAALVDMGRIAGMSAEQVDSCIGNQEEQKRITDVGQNAQTTYGIQGTPTFLVNGVTAPPWESYDDVKKYLDQVLAKK